MAEPATVADVSVFHLRHALFSSSSAAPEALFLHFTPESAKFDGGDE